MFSIAAINDTNSGGQWEPLAPTKEAQEFHLSQTYHEGLLKLQAKDYAQARQLLETVLKDPLISSAQACNASSDRHLLQLRFLSLKNLANVFLQQGPLHYESALQCYLQAVELDQNDSVVWNHLGSLSCKMGLLSTSRWAFEQGLLCSPNNWNCMEKLLEVLIAIGDEVACLSVSNLIVRHWPSHSRALHVKKTIEDAEPVPFAPRGIDKLEPKHVRLTFPEKRKSADIETESNGTTKKHKGNIELRLTGATWSALLDAILGVFPQTSRKLMKDCEPRFLHDHDAAVNEKLDSNQPDDTTREDGKIGAQTFGIEYSFTYSKINFKLPENSEINMDSVEGEEQGHFSECASFAVRVRGPEKPIVKEKDASTDREYPQERRSTRLERLRSRKSGKEELEASGKDQAKVVFQFLDTFVLKRPRIEDNYCSSTLSGACSVSLLYTSVQEHKDVVQFACKASKAYGAYQIAGLLLEEAAHKCISPRFCSEKFLELEKLTRSWGQDRSPLCSLFLAELYFDQGSCFAGQKKQMEYLSNANYHLCKVIELVSLYCPENLNGSQFSGTLATFDVNGTKGTSTSFDSASKKENILSIEDSQNISEAVDSELACQEKLEGVSTLTDENTFWVRFFWLSGRLSLSQDCKEKAFKEFCICLSLLRNNKNLKESSDCVLLRHCKFVKLLTVDRVLHEINLLKLSSLLEKAVHEMMEKGMYSECIDMLAPLLLSTKDVYLDLVFSVPKECERATSMELSALALLVSACEKVETMDIQAYLNCHRRILQILTVAAGMVGYPVSEKSKNSMQNASDTFDLEFTESTIKHLKDMIVEEVRDVSRAATRVKNFLDRADTCDELDSLFCTIANVQSLLLKVMYIASKTILNNKCSTSGTSSQTDQLEKWCLIDAAIAFCKLQHLDLSVSIKTQVDLIVAVHELLAEFGLCCAGRDGEGDEGTFLKFAIKHLLALDLKLKSLSVTNGQEETASLDKKTTETLGFGCLATQVEKEKPEAALETGKKCTDVNLESLQSTVSADAGTSDSPPPDPEIEEVELGIDNALDQSFFCLYGLKINPDSSGEEELAVHKNTSRGDYQTKEQCADVYQYILPYLRALSRTGLVKLRRVLRAIRKHFPQPPDDMLANNVIDKFLDGPEVYENKLHEVIGSNGSHEFIMNMLFSNGKVYDMITRSAAVSSEQYSEVYGNLYYFIAQAEEISATDRYPGFVLKKEGEEFVEQSANLFKYDLLYNPLRFESWQKLANIYDEEVDLLLNDGSKHINILDWRKNATLPQRVEAGRRRSRRCLLMSLALASTPDQQSQIHELLALVYYDSLQNVVPFYDQRLISPTKDAAWTTFAHYAMKHFEKAFELKPEWLHAFYLGKLCEKMGGSPAKALSYYSKAISLNPSGVDPVYRMHASRLKFLYNHRKESLEILQVVAAYAFSQSTKEAIINIFGWTSQDLLEPTLDVKDIHGRDEGKKKKNIESNLLDKAWHILYDDCLIALGICVEGELKHFHKARYMLAKGIYRRGEAGDVERAKDELSFCFKSSRSSFTVNMWEIDGITRKGRRKNPGVAGNKKSLEVSLSESSRKFITCIRKYLLLYLNLLEKTGDLCTLERAYLYLKTDKRFSLCLGDIVALALGKYIQVLILSIHKSETRSGSDKATSLEQMLEKLFSIFMDHVNLWADLSSLPELNNSVLLESNLYSYIHQYIHLLESDIRLDALEGINEKIRKRFKNPKLSNSNFAKICKHASLAWCRSITIKLALITPLPASGELIDQLSGVENGLLLFVDLQPDELLVPPPEDPAQNKGLDMNWFESLSKIKNIHVRQASEENMETAVTLMRCTYNFYRESSCGTFPSGINLHTVLSSLVSTEGLPQQGDMLDLSIPRKLLVWAYTLVHGRYSNISAVVKYCEEAKSRMKKGIMTSSAMLPATSPASVTSGGTGREKISDLGDPEDNASTPVPSATPVDIAHGSSAPTSNESQKLNSASPQLHRCNISKETISIQEGCKGSNVTDEEPREPKLR